MHSGIVCSCYIAAKDYLKAAFVSLAGCHAAAVIGEGTADEDRVSAQVSQYGSQRGSGIDIVEERAPPAPVAS
jgi:hypothetical protein